VAAAESEVAQPPTDFLPLALPGGFMALNGPFFGRRRAGGLDLGFVVEERHTNPAKVSHGGMLMSLARLQLAAGAAAGAGLDHLPRMMALSFDFLAPAPVGAWVEGETEVLHTTRNLVFLRGLLRIGGQPVLRASGVGRRGEEGAVALETLFAAAPPPPDLAPPPDDRAAGFRRLRMPGLFNASLAPLYGRLEDEDRSFVKGFRVGPRHDDGRGFCHPGVVLSVADMHTGFASLVHDDLRSFVPSISLNFDLIDRPRVGEWVELRTNFVNTAEPYTVADVVVSAGQGDARRPAAVRPLMRGNGFMRIAPSLGIEFDRGALFED
jgi:acyl-coenzyme A thioesterase PaaI-like protein